MTDKFFYYKYIFFFSFGVQILMEFGCINNNTKIILGEKIKPENIDNENKNERKCILKQCVTNIIKGVFKLTHEIVIGNLTSKSYSNVACQYIKYYKVDKSINNKRVCKTPFKKMVYKRVYK